MKSYNDICTGRENFDERNDCAVVAVSKACNLPYSLVHLTFQFHGRRSKQRTYDWVTERVLEGLGFNLVPINFIAKSVRQLEAELLVRGGNYLIRTNGHLLAFADGKVQDWTAGRKHRPKVVWRVEKVIQ